MSKDNYFALAYKLPQYLYRRFKANVAINWDGGIANTVIPKCL